MIRVVQPDFEILDFRRADHNADEMFQLSSSYSVWVINFSTGGIFILTPTLQRYDVIAEDDLWSVWLQEEDRKEKLISGPTARSNYND